MSQKRKLEEEDEKSTDLSTSNSESEQANKKMRPNEETDYSIDDVRCTICLDVVFCLTMRSLPCAHSFHESCIFQWLEISDVCPLCKFPTRRAARQNHHDYEESEYQSESDESDSGESNNVSSLVGTRRESPWFGMNGESQPSRSGSESTQVTSSGLPRRLNVLRWYDLYVWSDESSEGEDV